MHDQFLPTRVVGAQHRRGWPVQAVTGTLKGATETPALANMVPHPHRPHTVREGVKCGTRNVLDEAALSFRGDPPAVARDVRTMGEQQFGHMAVAVVVVSAGNTVILRMYVCAVR